MSLINDMLQDLEARDAPAPVQSVARRRRGRAVNWLLPVLGALSLAAVGLLAVWLIRDVPAFVGPSPDRNALAAAGAVSNRQNTPVENEAPADSAPTAVSGPQSSPIASTVDPAPALAVSNSDPDPKLNPDPDSELLAVAKPEHDQAQTRIQLPPDSTPTAQTVPPEGSGRGVQTLTQNPSPTDSAPTAAQTVQPAESDRDHSRTQNPSPVDAAPPTRQSGAAIVVRPTGRTRDAAAEGLDSARRALARGQTGVAISRLEQLLDQHPDVAEIRILMARTLLATDRYQHADQVLAEGLARDRANHEFAFWLARSQLRQNRTLRALETLQRHAPAVEADPGFHLLLAATLRQLGRHEDAFEHYGTITTASPDNTRAWLGRALSAETLGHADAARAAYARVLQGGEAESSRLARQRLVALGPDEPPN